MWPPDRVHRAVCIMWYRAVRSPFYLSSDTLLKPLQSTMTILGNQDERSPLKNAAASSTEEPPPYSSLPTPTPNPTPSSQAIPQAIPQTVPQTITQTITRTVPHSHHVVLHRRQSAIRRFLTAFLVAWLVILLWSALLHSFNIKKSRHGYEYEVVRLPSFRFFMFLKWLILEWK
jgi:hypothetical protein